MYSTTFIKTIKGSTQPSSPQIDQFKNFCNALLDNERSYMYMYGIFVNPVIGQKDEGKGKFCIQAKVATDQFWEASFLRSLPNQ